MSPHRSERTDRTGSKASTTPTEASSARKHTSKACEHCRKRRTKCIGGIPCDACKNASLEQECQVRTKARPQRYSRQIESADTRPVSCRHSVGRSYDEMPFETSGGPSVDTSGLGPPAHDEYASTADIAFMFRRSPSNAAKVEYTDKRHALAQVEDDLTTWCSNNGMMFDKVKRGEGIS